MPATNCASIESSSEFAISRLAADILPLGERLGGALVLADALHLDADAELLPEPAEEDVLGREPDHRRARRRRRADLVGRAAT